MVEAGPWWHPIHSAKVVLVRGVFPLRNNVDEGLPQPPEVELIMPNDMDLVPEHKDEEEDTEKD